MSSKKVNWLAVYALCIASYAVLSSSGLAFTGSWLVGFLAGAVVALGSLLDRTGTVSRWMAYGAAGLALALVVLQTVSDEARAVTSGACGGMLLVLAAWFSIKFLRR